MQEIIMRLVNFAATHLSMRERLSGLIGSASGWGVSLTLDPVLSTYTISGETWFMARSCILMILGAAISYVVPKMLKAIHLRFLAKSRLRKINKKRNQLKINSDNITK